MGDFRSLRVWQNAHALTLQVYELTRSFPASERYGLTSQIRRSAASVAANLADGCGRDTDPEIVRFARISLGSASELEYHLLLCRDLGLVDPTEHEKVENSVTEVRRMLAGLIARLAT